jgi:hypothetical protein
MYCSVETCDAALRRLLPPLKTAVMAGHAMIERIEMRKIALRLSRKVVIQMPLVYSKI